MNGLVNFMASQNGRILRIVVGIILIVLGLFGVGGVGGVIITIIGLVPLAAGIFDFCVFAPLAGLPFSGKDIRGK